jgi:hypothetical protein
MRRFIFGFLFLSVFLTGSGQNNDKLYLDLLAKRIDTLRLDDISNGYDSIQIRIWPLFYCSCRSLLLPQLIVLKYKNNNWSGVSYIIKGKLNDDSYAEFDTTTFIPTKPWDSFITDIKLDDLLKLKNIDDPDYLNTISTNGHVDLIEIATRDKYISIVFKESQENREKYWQADIFCNLIDIFNNEIKNNAR